MNEDILAFELCEVLEGKATVEKLLDIARQCLAIADRKLKGMDAPINASLATHWQRQKIEERKSSNKGDEG